MVQHHTARPALARAIPRSRRECAVPSFELIAQLLDALHHNDQHLSGNGQERLRNERGAVRPIDDGFFGLKVEVHPEALLSAELYRSEVTAASNGLVTRRAVLRRGAGNLGDGRV